MVATEQKAVLLEKRFGDIVVSTIDVPKPGKEEVLVKIQSSALNPVDWKIQKGGFYVDKFPSVLGSDIAGEVVALGASVTQFGIGDKVFFQGLYNQNEHTGFQQYTTADVHTLAKIPSNISYDEASTIPVANTAAYVGLYNVNPHGVGFEPPVKPGAKGKYADTPIVILGGSSSVGQFAIQLAKLSGFSPIITTSSPRHSELLQSLGASHVLDRNLPLSKARMGAISEKSIKVVYDAISSGDTQETGLSLLASGGQLAIVQNPRPQALQRAQQEDKRIVHVIGAKALPHNVDLMREFWAHATLLLENGDIKPNRPEILPGGLYGIPPGLKRLEENKVSGVKLVSRPQETE